MENKEEVWKDVVGFEGFYQTSSFSNVRSLDRVSTTKKGVVKHTKGKNLSLTVKSNKYLSVMFSVNSKVKRFHVHRLSATAFIPNPENKPDVNHKDTNKQNNNILNLEWCTKLENMKHASENGLTTQGEKSISAKLTSEKVLAIRRLYLINPNFNKTEIAKKLNIADSTVHKIIKRQRWKHI